MRGHLREKFVKPEDGRKQSRDCAGYVVTLAVLMSNPLLAGRQSVSNVPKWVMCTFSCVAASSIDASTASTAAEAVLRVVPEPMY